MHAHPMLNLNDITPDPELVRQLPPALALYYLALPLAREDGQVSVALAHPENTTALAILSRLLGGAVVPVCGAAGTIRAVLLSHQPAQIQPDAAILGWSPELAWTPAVTAWTQLLAAALAAPASVLEQTQATPDANLVVVTEERYRLMVLGMRPEVSPAAILSQAKGPLLFVRSREFCPLRRILVALRGFSSDEYVLEWVTALAQHAGAGVTLLPLFSNVSPFGRLESMLNGNNLAQAALGDYLRRFHTEETPTNLKLRQGSPVRQIADEYGQGDYDLLFMAAEGVGEFVLRVLAEIDQQTRGDYRPVLVLKPSYA